MQRRATVVAELRASRIDVVAEEALGEGEEHGQHLDGKITSRRKSRSGEFRYLPKGDDGDLAYAEMHEIQPPSGRNVWCANVHEASDARFKRRCDEHEKSPSRSSGKARATGRPR